MAEKTSSVKSATSEKSRTSSSDDTILAAADSKRQTNIFLDVGEEHIRMRSRWWQIWIPRDPPPPPQGSLSDAPITPVATASLLSILTYTWVTPLMVTGFQRTLQATDLWKMDESRESHTLSETLDASWSRRVAEAKDWNVRLEDGTIKPSVLKRANWSIRALFARRPYYEQVRLYEERWRKVDGQKHARLYLALNDTIGYFFWLGGAFKVLGDTSQLMGPLLVKAIINFAKARAAAKENGEPVPSIGRGIAMAIGLFFIIITSSVTQHQFFWRSMITGVLARAALISSIYKRGVKLTGKARTKLSNSDLVNHISTDVSRIDQCAQWFHAAWTAPIQVTVCLIILLVQLGPSALAGFALFLIIIPIQQRVMAQQFRIRRTSMKYTSARAKTLLEVLGSMRVVKYFCYEQPFLDRIFDVRNKELLGVRGIQNSQSANAALAYSIPVLAATLAFITYTKTTAGFDVAIIFSSLSLFQLLRQPMMFLPRALSAIADARNALARLTHVYHAELMSDVSIHIDSELEWALQMDSVTFTWEEASSSIDDDKGDETKESLEENLSEPFQVKDVTLQVPRGTLVALVGRVGSGKSSLLQGLIGEMRKTSGKVTFGGRIAYCPQSAWIQNTTLRDNILFGQEFEEERYWKVVEVACLLPDLEQLPNGDMTEIGEKGINLSGGQKQRINIARALYYNADIVILDDPLSAVDAHVGKALFHGAIIESLRNQGKTVIFVTHALHFLSHCDYIYTLSNGRIAEQGTFQELVASQGEFARLDGEFGGRGHNNSDSTRSVVDKKDDTVPNESAAARQISARGSLEGRLIVNERRTTGSVSRRVYGTYLKAGRGIITVPLLALAILLMQGSQVMSSYTLVWWQENTFQRPFSFYQALYAVMGLSQSSFTFLMGLGTDTISYYVSQNLHHNSVQNIFHAPMSFFDTTPLGRVQGIFGKDIDIIDNQLPISIRLLSLTLSGVFGAIIIITVVEHYFIIIAIFISLGYQYFASFYRASAREVKRLDAMLRSLLYAHLSESLTGLPTLRSYGEIPRSVKDNEFFIDLENRALFLTVTNQRWLAIRLDFCGAILVFSVAIFAVVGISGINPAQVGLVLTYTTSLTQLCGMLTRQTADVENYMNSVERVVHYSRTDMIAQEAPHEIEDKKPAPYWPDQGAITFQNMSMKYRPGLPDVLHDISIEIRGGEKIGVVGRTGAGKSSLALALLRIIEFSGSIIIDGVDISKIGLRDLRSKLSIIPQDPTIFSGTVRTALDPFSVYDDARLWDALRRSYLVDNEVSETDLGNRTRITLDTIIETEGSNLSVGERSLMSLARALVKDSKVVIMDEATASVDLETDKKIQETITTQFKDRTLLCIAHRLRTILGYNRILVLDAGRVVEFDTPLNLFEREGSIFRGLCERSNISLQDIMEQRR